MTSCKFFFMQRAIRSYLEIPFSNKSSYFTDEELKGFRESLEQERISRMYDRKECMQAGCLRYTVSQLVAKKCE